MHKKLLTTLLFIIICTTISAQSTDFPLLSSLLIDHNIHQTASADTQYIQYTKKKVFSYKEKKYSTCAYHIEIDQASSRTNYIVLMDIISSDEGSDFNCSGGFCMDKSHFHKKGLTINRQLFDYFVKISC